MKITIDGADTALKRNAAYSAIEDLAQSDFDKMDYHFTKREYGVECLVLVEKTADEIKCKINI